MPIKYFKYLKINELVNLLPTDISLVLLAPDMDNWLRRIKHLLIVILFGFLGNAVCYVLSIAFYSANNFDIGKITLAISASVVSFCIMNHIIVLKKVEEEKPNLERPKANMLHIINTGFLVTYVLILGTIAYSSGCKIVSPDSMLFVCIIFLIVLTSVGVSGWSLTKMIHIDDRKIIKITS